jgi:hypothetical protein
VQGTGVWYSTRTRAKFAIHTTRSCSPRYDASSWKASGFINDRRRVAGRFSRQEGFGVFSYSYSHSYSHSQLDTVIRHIQNPRASSTQELQRRIHRAVKRFNVPHVFHPRSSTRCRSYGAAPSIAADGVTIKISLLRSMYRFCKMSKPQIQAV